MRDRFDVVVVGSGAGGGVVAGEFAQRGRDVLLLEAGPHRTAADFMRWEAHANHDIWWPLRLAPLPDGDVVAFLAGRCVGGTTTINTKVALRAHERDVAKWHAATGLTNDAGAPFEASDLQSYYDRVEQVLGVRERTDWPKSVHTVEPGFRALGVELEPVRAYTDENCMRCGSCLQGCSTNAGKSTMDTDIHDALAHGRLELRAEAIVERVLIEDARAVGVEYVEEWKATRQTAHAGVVVVAARRTQHAAAARRAAASTTPTSESTSACTRCVSCTGSSTSHRTRTWSTRSRPTAWISSTTRTAASSSRPRRSRIPSALRRPSRDEQGPFGGPRLVEAVRGFRNWIGLLALVNDENGSAVVVDEAGRRALRRRLPAGRDGANRCVARLQPPGARGCGREADLLDRGARV